SSPDAANLVSLLDSEMFALPLLKSALGKHLRRFPSTHNGLGRIENAGLELIAAGHREVKSLFPAFTRRESEYGFGDAQFYLEMKRLANASVPLLTQATAAALQWIRRQCCYHHLKSPSTEERH